MKTLPKIIYKLFYMFISDIIGASIEFGYLKLEFYLLGNFLLLNSSCNCVLVHLAINSGIDSHFDSSSLLGFTVHFV